MVIFVAKVLDSFALLLPNTLPNILSIPNTGNRYFFTVMAAVDHTIKSGSFYGEDTEKVSRGYSETEDREEEQEYQREGQGQLKLDADGLPLIPQPTDSPNDVS